MRRKPKLKISMQDIENLYKPIKKEVMNTENRIEVPAMVEPTTKKELMEFVEKFLGSGLPELKKEPEFIEVSIFGSKLEPVLGKIYKGQFLGVEEVEQVNENGEVTYFDSCNFAVETMQESGVKRYDKKFVSTTTFLKAAKRGALIPNEWYKLEYKGEGTKGINRYHIWDIVHIKRV